MSRSTPPPESDPPEAAAAATALSYLHRKLVKAFRALNIFAQYRRLEAAEDRLLELDRRARELQQALDAGHASLAQGVGVLQGELESLRDERTPRAEQRLDRIEQDLRTLQQEVERVNQEHGQGALRLDAAEQALRRAATEVERLRDGVLPAMLARENTLIDRLAEELEEQASLIERLLRREPLPAPPAIGEGDLSKALAEVQPVLAAAFRSEGNELVHRLDRHLPDLADHAPVLDLGAGRGELLQLLREAGITASGIEADPALSQAARRRGLQIIDGELPEALRRLADASFGAVVALHVLERFAPAVILQILRECRRLLRGGGTLLVQILNPATLRVGADLFWHDLRRQRPLVVPTLERILVASGFTVKQRELLDRAPAEERLFRTELQAGGASGEQDQSPRDLDLGLHERITRLEKELDQVLNGPRVAVIRACKPNEDVPPAGASRPARTSA